MQINTPQHARRFILASGSPRRAELVGRMGLEFIVDSPNVPEDDVDGTPEHQVCTLARRKAEAIAGHYGKDAWVLGADTLVYCERILGKPQTEAEAVAMLRHLSGRWHGVHSGICLIDNRTGNVGVKHVLTKVRFHTLTDKAILEYVATGDPMDKAGAYGIQGLAGMYIERIEGCYTNVMGLSMSGLRQLFQAMGWDA